MKKIFIIGTLLCMQSMNVCADRTIEEGLGDAVNGSQTLQVQQLLRRLDRDSMALAQKKTLVSDLADLAQKIHENKKTRVSFLGSKKDFAMSSIGSLIGTYAMVSLWCSTVDVRANYQRYTWADLFSVRENAPFYKASKTFVPAFFGAYVAYKGLTCSTQYADIKQSRAVRNSLQQKKEELGL